MYSSTISVRNIAASNTSTQKVICCRAVQKIAHSPTSTKIRKKMAVADPKPKMYTCDLTIMWATRPWRSSPRAIEIASETVASVDEPVR